MLHWLLNEREKGPELAAAVIVCGALGLVGLIASVGHLASQPWYLRHEGVVTRAVSMECGTVFGDSYAIMVGGKRFEGCAGGNKKCPTHRADILYDPTNPGRCRSKATVSHPGMRTASQTVVLRGA